MTNSTPTIAFSEKNERDQEIWSNLRSAIAKSSGFQSWLQERNIASDTNLDQQVQRYLKETLETLAY